MSSLPHANPTTGPGRPAGAAPRLARCLAAAALVAASLAVTACGGAAPAPTILNTEKIERAIEHSSLTQRNTRTQVSCPSGVHQKKGLTFACTAVAKAGTTRFVITELDNAGHVHYEGR